MLTTLIYPLIPPAMIIRGKGIDADMGISQSLYFFDGQGEEHPVSITLKYAQMEAVACPSKPLMAVSCSYGYPKSRTELWIFSFTRMSFALVDRHRFTTEGVSKLQWIGTKLQVLQPAGQLSLYDGKAWSRLKRTWPDDQWIASTTPFASQIKRLTKPLLLNGWTHANDVLLNLRPGGYYACFPSDARNWSASYSTGKAMFAHPGAIQLISREGTQTIHVKGPFTNPRLSPDGQLYAPLHRGPDLWEIYLWKSGQWEDTGVNGYQVEFVQGLGSK